MDSESRTTIYYFDGENGRSRLRSRAGSKHSLSRDFRRNDSPNSSRGEAIYERTKSRETRPKNDKEIGKWLMH